MPNETLVAIPQNFESPNSIRLFLSRLLEELDIVLGLRGDSESGSTVLEDLASRIEQLESSIKQLTDLTLRIETLESSIANHASRIETLESSSAALTQRVETLEGV